jgi:hypothetical protein
MQFVVYTHFGRILARFPLGDKLHHEALDQARRFMATSGKKCWVRLAK